MSDNRAYIRGLADARAALHRGSKTKIHKDADNTGMRGEFAFGQLIGLHPDTTLRVSGDAGMDFIVPVLTSIDVKTRRERSDGKKCNLIVEAGKVHADIYVQAVLSADETSCDCIGWIRGRDVRSYHPRDMGHRVLCHAVPEDELLAMDLLLKRITHWLDYSGRFR